MSNLIIWILGIPVAIMIISKFYSEIDNPSIFLLAFFWPIVLPLFVINKTWNALCGGIMYIIVKTCESKAANAFCESVDSFITKCKGK